MNSPEIRIDTGKALVTLSAPGEITIRVQEEEYLEVDDLRKINEAKDHFAQNKPYVVLFFAPNFGSISKEGREYSSTPEVYKNAIAKAIICPEIAGRLIGNIFIQFNKPPAPTRVFTNEHDAREWLTEQRSKSLHLEKL